MLEPGPRTSSWSSRPHWFVSPSVSSLVCSFTGAYAPSVTQRAWFWHLHHCVTLLWLLNLSVPHILASREGLMHAPTLEGVEGLNHSGRVGALRPAPGPPESLQSRQAVLAPSSMLGWCAHWPRRESVPCAGCGRPSPLGSAGVVGSQRSKVAGGGTLGPGRGEFRHFHLGGLPGGGGT